MESEHLLLEGLRRGALICADETKVRLKGQVGYVWAFSSVQDVVYRFSESRDGSILDEIVEGFDGVLVSDYYGAYDSPSCKQQKCLVHLIRDINDDLLKTPFDYELKQLAERFTVLLQAIVETIDRFGLKRRYLSKFVSKANGFRKWVADQDFQSTPARRYQKRIGKYGDRLFTFLSQDGVPWNNNIAENAVKLIASRRRIFGASFAERGFSDYLVFLSIFQSLRRKGGSFLRFLLSGETDIDKFLNF